MTTFTDEVRETVSPYKFGGSRRAAMCYLLSLDGGTDEESGNVESPTGWFARFGRTIQYADSQGFISCETFPTEAAAKAFFSRLDDEYSAWDDEGES